MEMKGKWREGERRGRGIESIGNEWSDEGTRRKEMGKQEIERIASLKKGTFEDSCKVDYRNDEGEGLPNKIVIRF